MVSRVAPGTNIFILSGPKDNAHQIALATANLTVPEVPPTQ